MFYEQIPLRACLTNCQSFDMKNLLETIVFFRSHKKNPLQTNQNDQTTDQSDHPEVPELDLLNVP